MATFGAWHATLWDRIQVDELVEETRKLTRDLKQLNKAARGYEVYRCGSRVRLPRPHARATCLARPQAPSHARPQAAGGGAARDADLAAAGVRAAPPGHAQPALDAAHAGARALGRPFS